MRTATHSVSKIPATSEAFASVFWSEMVTAAAYVEPLAANKHSIAVHHRVPGKSLLQTMISLCPGCHAKVHRTKAVLSEMPPLLLELWREQHPYGHEQTMLDFRGQQLPAVLVPLFDN